MRHVELDSDMLIQAMRDFRLFQPLSNAEIETLAPIAEAWEYDAGETIIKERTMGSFLYAILDGEIVITKRIAGQDVTIGTAGPGEVMGETTLFRDIERTANAIAKTDAQILSFARTKLFSFVADFPEIGFKLFAFFALALLKKLDRVNHSLGELRESHFSMERLEDVGEDFPQFLQDILEKK